MKKLFSLFITLLTTLSLSANNVVTLTTSGQGESKETATANALRSAIEQAFGVFVSANTTILNDELVRDEIATVASGNIQKYEELSCASMPNGEMLVTLSATVAIDNLQSYAQSHGSTAEFAGQTFAMNMRMRELNKKNEQIALLNMFYHLQELGPHVFDWKVNIGDPSILNEQYYKVPMTVTAEPNEASTTFYNILTSTLKSLSLTPSEVEEYRKAGLSTYRFNLKYGRCTYTASDSDTPIGLEVVLRNDPEMLFVCLGHLIDAVNSSFRIKTLYTSGNTSYPEMAIESKEFIGKREYWDRIDFYITDFPKYKMKSVKTAQSSPAKKNSKFLERLKTAADDFVSSMESDYSTYGYTDGKHIVRQIIAFIEQDKISQVQGFEIEHSKINRLEFATDYISDQIKKLEINQNVLPDQYWYDRYGSDSFHKLQIMSIEVLQHVSIGESAFQAQPFLKEITLSCMPDKIGPHAFRDCSHLASITIADNVNMIHYSNLRYFANLEDIYLKSIMPPVMQGEYPSEFLGSIKRDYKIYVPTQSVDVYSQAPGWEDIKDHIVGCDFK